MDTPTQNASVERLSVMHGLLIGIAAIVLSVVFRLVDPLLQFSSLWVGFLTLIIVIALFVILGLDVRKKIGGFWSFGVTFKSLMIMAVILCVCSTTYNFILFKYIDPELPSKVSAVMLDKTTTALQKAGIDQSKIDESTKSFRNGEVEAKMQPTLKNELIAFGGGLVLYGIINLIIAACIKRKAPLYIATDEEPLT
jgi:uncharacterized membrane protein YvlD (DUF360 family)